jgi:hypothetical protein
MSFTGNHICTSYKKELLEGNVHDFNSDTFKLALYDEDATLNAETTVYSASDEVSGTGYSAGGAALTVVAPTTSGKIAYASFADLTFSTVTLTARGGLIYNSSAGNKAVLVVDFGRNIIKTAEDLVITMPTADSLNAIIRL